ncbi:MAG TPA: ABC transporter substrate-binding protein [Phototrophicaceae bacterium]|nr:ABC transporter substrate-binding protein [Phototrophicaceae bacterium]
MKRYAILLSILLLVVVPSVLAQQTDNSDVLLRNTVGGNVTTLNPVLAADSASIDIISFLYAPLFQVDAQTAQPEPGLATWKISDDGLTYTFTIVDGAKWSDGTPITSKDVEFTYNAIINDKVSSPRKGDMALIKSFNVIDDKNFSITLSAPNCTVWGSAFGDLTPIPASQFAADYSDFNTSAFNTAPTVTSGPYVWSETKPDEYVKLTANANYYKGAPQIPTIINRVITDTAVQNQALQTGEIDYDFMYPDQLEQLGDTSKFNVTTAPLNNTPMLIMNWADGDNPQPAYDADGKPVTETPNKFFGDVRVRQAVAMGYDKSSIVQTLGDKGGFLLSGPITPMFGWVNSNVQPWPYDPTKAAQLLDEAGWKLNPATGIREKDGVPFEVSLVYAPLVDLYTNIALVAQDQLGQLGIKVDVKSEEWSSYLTNVLLPQKYDITIVGFGGGTEVDGIAYNILDSKNDIPGSGFDIASYVNPKVDQLLDQGRSMVGCSPTDRAPIYQQIQQIAHDDVAYDFTVGTNQVHVMNKRVTGFNPGPWNAYLDIEKWGLGGS